jgi:hypothetical protein
MTRVVTFTLRAQDPGGEFLRSVWAAAVYPQIGDTLMLPDGSDVGQDVIVDERVLSASGEVEVWVGEFDGWTEGSVKRIFTLIDELRMDLVAQ